MSFTYEEKQEILSALREKALKMRMNSQSVQGADWSRRYQAAIEKLCDKVNHMDTEETSEPFMERPSR